MGRRANLEVALDMAREFGREVEPDEFFIATHIKKGGGWVDDQDRLREVESQIGDNSSFDGSTKLQIWKDVAGGMTQGRCYGTEDLSTNIRPDVTSLTQEFRAHTSGSDGSRHSSEETLRQKILEANLKATRVEEKAARLEEDFAQLRHQMELLLEAQSAGGSTNFSQAQAQAQAPAPA